MPVTRLFEHSADERRFLFLVQQTPNFALHVMRVLSDRLRRMDERLGCGTHP